MSELWSAISGNLAGIFALIFLLVYIPFLRKVFIECEEDDRVESSVAAED